MEALKLDDKTLRMAILLDFFGELLTDKQREYFDLYYNENLSLSEIAEQYGISRQGVYDIITRAERTLLATEEKTGVVARFSEMRRIADEALKLAQQLALSTHEGNLKLIADELCGALTILKGKV